MDTLYDNHLAEFYLLVNPLKIHNSPSYVVELCHSVRRVVPVSTLPPSLSLPPLSSPSLMILVINRVEAKDSGTYRCRVDFRTSQTRNTFLKFDKDVTKILVLHLIHNVTIDVDPRLLVGPIGPQTFHRS